MVYGIEIENENWKYKEKLWMLRSGWYENWEGMRVFIREELLFTERVGSTDNLDSWSLKIYYEWVGC